MPTSNCFGERAWAVTLVPTEPQTACAHAMEGGRFEPNRKVQIGHAKGSCRQKGVGESLGTYRECRPRMYSVYGER